MILNNVKLGRTVIFIKCFSIVVSLIVLANALIGAISIKFAEPSKACGIRDTEDYLRTFLTIYFMYLIYRFLMSKSYKLVTRKLVKYKKSNNSLVFSYIINAL